MKAPLLTVAAIIALTGALVSCGNDEEIAPGTAATVSQAVTSSASASPTPISTLPTTPSLPDAWRTYADPVAAFSLPRPPGLTVSEERYQLPEKKGLPAAEGRLLWFRTAAGVPAMVVAVATNPGDLTIEEWVSTYTGWSGTPQEFSIGGERALLDPTDQVNNPVPQIYFRHGQFFFTLQLNIRGIPESGFPAALSDSDFKDIVEGFRFAE